MGWSGTLAPGGRPMVVPASIVEGTKSPTTIDTALAWPLPHATRSRRLRSAARSLTLPEDRPRTPAAWTTWVSGSLGPSSWTSRRSPGSRVVSAGWRARDVPSISRLIPARDAGADPAFSISTKGDSPGNGSKPTSESSSPASPLGASVATGVPGAPVPAGGSDPAGAAVSAGVAEAGGRVDAGTLLSAGVEGPEVGSATSVAGAAIVAAGAAIVAGALPDDGPGGTGVDDVQATTRSNADTAAPR